MNACTFFGHGNCPDSVAPHIREVIRHLVEDHAVTMFYVGNNGHFDTLVRQSLRKLKLAYPQVRYAVVLAYMPKEKKEYDFTDYSDTMLPEGIETVHPRFAISWCNKWMLKQSQYVVTYITHSWGGAVQFAEMAEKQKKHVINLALRENERRTENDLYPGREA